MVYNVDYKTVQFCDGTNWISMAGGGGGGSETDPQVGTLTNGKWCTTDGTAVNCTQDAPAASAGADTQVILNSSGSLAGDASFVWDNTNKRLGIGTATPEQKFHVSGGSILLDNAQVLQWKDSAGTPRNVVSYNASNNLTLFTDSTNGADIAMGVRGSELIRLRQTTANVGVGTQTPAASALLDVTSTTKGFLPPRMTTAQVGAIATPADGLIVYDTDIDAIKLRANGAWASLADSTSASASGVAGAVQFSGGSGAFASDDANFHWDDTNKRLGIGTAAPNYRFQVVETKTNTAAGTVPMSQFVLTANPASASSAGFYSIYSQINTSGTASLTGLSPILGFLNHAGTGTVASGFGAQGTVFNGAGGTVTNAYAVAANVNNASTGAITNAYGVTTSLSNAGGGAVTNWYGLYVGALSGAAPTTGRFPLYVADTGNNYFAGNVGIATTAPAGKLHVQGGDNTRPGLYLSGGIADLVWPAAEVLQIGQWDGATTFTERLRIDASGNVGIGTTGPSQKLDVAGTIKATAFSGDGAAVTGVVHNVAVQTYYTAGTYTYTPPAGTRYIEILVQGAGGGGGGTDGQNTSGYIAISGGGGAGGWTKKLLNNPTGSFTVVAGAAGVGGTGNVAGTAGGSSSFSGTAVSMSATGGGGGTGELQAASGSGASGAAGVGSGGDLNGGPPSPRIQYTRWVSGTWYGLDGAYGGTSIFGYGTSYTSNATNTGDATICGSGGGGVYESTVTTANYGAADGAPGCVIIYAHY